VYAGVLSRCAALQMARAEEVEDFGRLNSVLPEAEANQVMAEAEVDPAPLLETGEGSHTAPAYTVSGGGSPTATMPMAEDPRRRRQSQQWKIPWRLLGLRRWLSVYGVVREFCLCY
jgi:hypothetical protein